MGGSSSEAKTVEKSETTIEQEMSITDDSWSYTDNSKRFVDQSIIDNSKQYFDESVLDQSQSSISEILTDTNVQNHVYIDQTQRAVSDAEVLAMGSGNYLKSVHEFDFRGTREGDAIAESNPMFGNIRGGATESSYVSDQTVGFSETGTDKGDVGFGRTGSELTSSQRAGQVASPETRQISTATAQSAGGLFTGMGQGFLAGSAGASSLVPILIAVGVLGVLGFGLFMLFRKGRKGRSSRGTVNRR